MKSLSLTFIALAASARASSGDGDWASAYSKASSSLANLQNEDKVSIVTGVGWTKGPCVGNTGSVDSIGYPALCLQDSPLGVRYVEGSVTAFPPGIQAAATWDTDLMYQRGFALGSESKAVGVHVQLGPVAGPIGKIPTSGRQWEGFSPDPYLNGIAMASTVEGMQAAGVQACAKHFIGNEQENRRDQMSANIDDRTLHELYLWPFVDAVHANVTSVMCSYNQVNSTFACSNDHILNDILKGELDFQGYVMSDWNAQHATSDANAGLDMSMPGTDFSGNNMYWGQNLLDAVNNGSVPQSRLDDMALRILAGWYLVGQDQGYPDVTFSSWNGGTGAPDSRADHNVTARAVARDGIVLLKNINGTLPLNKPDSLAIIGSDSVTNPDGPNACADRACDTGTLGMGWGSGTAQYPYLIAPYDAINSRAQADGTKVVQSDSDDTGSAADAASSASTAIVFINADSGEGYLTVEGNAGDRINLDPWHDGNSLVEAVANANENTIVVVHSVGPIIMESILALPGVTAIVWAGLPGQESGDSLVDVLYGDVSPSGKLPYTIAKEAGDYGTAVVDGDDDYPEGLYVDYRHFDESNITPRYEFGFGLSYANFSYSGLSAVYTDKGGVGTTIAPGGPSNLWDTVATVTATVQNSGSVTAAEVAQLYITLPDSAPKSPPKQLRGFQKLSLDAGASGVVTFNLRRRDLAYWDVDSQKWNVPSGTFGVSVGGSSRDLPLQGSM